MNASLKQLSNWSIASFINWLKADVGENPLQNMTDFDKLTSEIKAGDVILFESRSRFGKIIKLMTLSPWTHVALCIGKLEDIKDPSAIRMIKEYYHGPTDVPLVIEALLPQGATVSSIEKYQSTHLRICRPTGLSQYDKDRMLIFALEHLGIKYDLHQFYMLGKHVFPYSIIPKRWSSQVFITDDENPTGIICSGLIARCFQHVKYPVLPLVEVSPHSHCSSEVNLHPRSFKFFIPSDFDTSPFFEVVKFPSKVFQNTHAYQDLPWKKAHSFQEAPTTPLDNIPAMKDKALIYRYYQRFVKNRPYV